MVDETVTRLPKFEALVFLNCTLGDDGSELFVFVPQYCMGDLFLPSGDLVRDISEEDKLNDVDNDDE